MDVSEGGGLDHQFAGGEDLHGGPGLLYLREKKLRLSSGDCLTVTYLVVDVLPALRVELTGLVSLVPLQELLEMTD